MNKGNLKCSRLLIFLSLFFVDVQATSISEVFTILTCFVKNPNQVGEIAPLSSTAASELVRFVGQESLGGRYYLEAGGGCGAVSIHIAQRLQPNDHLDVIEIDPKMCVILKKRLAPYTNVSVHCCSILEWHPEYLYDGIVCTLPFNSLGLVLTQLVMKYFNRMANKECVISYVEYPIVKQALQYLYTAERKERFRAVQQYLESVRDGALQEKCMVYLNVPPVAIYHMCFDV